jgi:arylsulfatase A-like enzyme
LALGRLRASPRGKRVDELVRNIDLLPTVGSILGVEMPERVAGASLLGLIEGKPEPPRLAYAKALNTAVGYRLSRWGLTRSRRFTTDAPCASGAGRALHSQADRGNRYNLDREGQAPSLPSKRDLPGVTEG